MMRTYPPLKRHSLRSGSLLLSPDQRGEHVQLNFPALAVLTDFRRIPAATIDTEAPMEAANRFMIRRGVRLLLVTDGESRVLGLITANDILGEKPIKLISELRLRRQDLLVRDVMTPQERLDVLTFDDVQQTEVGHIVSTLHQAQRQHALVCEKGGNGADGVRGVFSLSQIARQLGISIQTSEIAITFAEIEAALGN
jgi:signal-transduction protein with cAMP-binding, CBS, and nucleotidyltransferase domain